MRQPPSLFVLHLASARDDLAAVNGNDGYAQNEQQALGDLTHGEARALHGKAAGERGKHHRADEGTHHMGFAQLEHHGAEEYAGKAVEEEGSAHVGLTGFVHGQHIHDAAKGSHEGREYEQDGLDAAVLHNIAANKGDVLGDALDLLQLFLGVIDQRCQLIQIKAGYACPEKLIQLLEDGAFDDDDIDDEEELAEKYGVSSIPCFVVLKDGEEVAREVGAMPLKKLEKLVGVKRG